VSGFNRHPAVIDGCSDVLVEIFVDAGRHTRSAVGLAELPFDICVEIEMIAQVYGQRSTLLALTTAANVSRGQRGSHSRASLRLFHEGGARLARVRKLVVS